MHQGVTEATRAFYFTLPFVCSVKLSRLQIMKASLFAEDDDDSDMFHDHAAMKVSTDVSSPRPAGRSGPTLWYETLAPSHDVSHQSVNRLQ